MILVSSLNNVNNSKKASSCVAQYPVPRTVQSALHFTSLTDLFTQTPYRLLWEASSHMLKLMREGRSYTYPPLSIGRYSFIQLSELEQCRVKKLAQGFNTVAQDSNPGSRSRVRSSTPESLRSTKIVLVVVVIADVAQFILVSPLCPPRLLISPSPISR